MCGLFDYGRLRIALKEHGTEVGGIDLLARTRADGRNQQKEEDEGRSGAKIGHSLAPWPVAEAVRH